ncbi:HEAT repeat domain-containing protein [Paenibacillus sp. NEAU-GSW1]|uniref:HEAT repeat domain-containing protein n=1 Tax=Paenibacillus sp. NEAU-GSW1 TaxID=2682486 RepID=UPI0012E26617|nr:HEAT repeat domain-containing protein [Paenibacillus sp. NEAU-GSW1]MUT68115.1 hypothetical protein [Paenibacillus sp. NEAU-GSW1]
MSVELLLDLQREVRRLFVAGSALAEGDLRLSKLLPSLRKAGEAAPIFSRLADSAEGLLTAPRTDSAIKLLELSTLLSAILHTQGKTDVSGEQQKLDSLNSGLSTEVTYRRLHPLLEALTTKGAGRLEQIRQAYEDRSFLDLRALPAICRALDDVYSEIQDFVQHKLLPEFGPAAVPAVRGQLDLQGGKGAARRLQFLHSCLGENALELLIEAGSSGSPDLKAAAIELLGGYDGQEPFLLEQSREKRKEIREAAYYALSRLATPLCVERLFEAVLSKDAELVIDPIRKCKELNLHKRIIEHAEQQLNCYLNSEGKEKASALQQLHNDLRCLREKGEPLAEEAFALLGRLLSTDEFMASETEAVQETAAEMLLELNSEPADRFAIGLHSAYKGKFIGYSFRSAFKRLSPPELYDRYAGALKGRNGAAKRLQAALRQIVHEQLADADDNDDYTAVVPADAWDSRWTNVFAEQDLTDLVCSFTQQDDRSITAYLVSKLKTGSRVNEYQTQNVLLTLFRIGYKDAPELFMGLLEQKFSRSFYYIDWRMRTVFASLPKTYAPRLRAFAETVSNETVKNELLEIVEALEALPDEPAEEGAKGVWSWIKNKMY